MRKLNTFAFLASFMSLGLANASQIPMVGDFDFSVKTNTRAIRFSGEVEAVEGSIQRTDRQGHNYEVVMKLNPEWFKTGVGLRDDHLREQILKNRPLQFTGKGECPELRCRVSGEIVLGDHKGEITVELEWSEDRQSLSGQSQLSLTALGIEAPSYLGVTVQDQIPVEFKLKALR